MAALSPYRVRLFSINLVSGRGPDTDNGVRAVIDDASDIGVSSYANDIGEMFFTLPMTHPQISECVPLERHYEVSRRNAAGTYEVIHKGILEDYDATKDEVVFYGHDYLGFFTKSVLTSTTSYTNTLIGTIINNTFTARQNEANSPVGFLGTGTIDATSRTVTVTAPHEEYLSFWSGLCQILAAGGTTRPMVYIDLSADNFFNFDDNRGSDKQNVRLEFGGAILDFRYNLGFANLRHRNRAIGVKREGATVLYSTQTTGSASQYGTLDMATLFTDVINQASLDSLALSAVRDAFDRSGNLYISLAQGHCKPLDGWDLGDSIRLVVQRGIVDINDLYTVWGWEWIGRKDGSESLFLDVQPKLT